MKELEFTIAYDEGLSLLTVVTHGAFTVEAHEKMIRAVVAHPHWPDCSRLLANHLDSSAGHQNQDEVIRIAALTEHYFHDHWPGKFAVLMKRHDSLSYGNATLWQVVTSAESPSDIRIFYSLEKAMDWLKAPLPST